MIFPKWKEVESNEREITLGIKFLVSKKRDTGFFEFLIKQLSLDSPDEQLSLGITVVYRNEPTNRNVEVECFGKKYNGLDAQEVLKRLQTSHSIFFHNSTEVSSFLPFSSLIGGEVETVSSDNARAFSTIQKNINKGLAQVSRGHQREIEALLGKLEEKYRVSISTPKLDFSSVPFNVTLGDKKIKIPLDDWGSGTKNRTLILFTLLQAKQLSESDPSAAKITPMIVIEET